MKLMSIFCLLFFILTVNASVGIKPIYSVSKTHILGSQIPLNKIIHETENHYLVKSPSIDFRKNDYFYLQLHERLKDISWLKDKGQIVEYVEGEFAVLIPQSDEKLLEVAQILHEFGGQCGTLQKLSPLPIELNTLASAPLITSKDTFVVETLNTANTQNIIETIKTMVSWGTRYHNDSDGIQTAEKLKNLYEQIIPSHRQDVEFELFKHKGSQQDSLVVRIPGKSNPSEIVILGSHLDSINNNDNKNAPGADDNASGTATNMEVFRNLMQHDIYPERTIEIHAYGAEEIGLVGSGEMADSYKTNSKKVVSMVQFDMNGYSQDGSRKIYFVSNNTDSNLTKQLGQLVDNYLSTPWTTQFLMFGSSDHASWKKRGFPVAFPTENPFAFNNNIHTSKDTLDKMNVPEQMGDFAKLGVAYLMHFAGY